MVELTFSAVAGTRYEATSLADEAAQKLMMEIS
jgi:hypothetical protein